MSTYQITRFICDPETGKVTREGPIKSGLTLEEAQAHCRDDSTHGNGWFDGYEEE